MNLVEQWNEWSCKDKEKVLFDKRLKSIPYRKIDTVNWPEFPEKIDSSFKIVRLQDGLFIHFAVYNETVRAEELEDNGPVYQDSCIEFFVAPDGLGYYNFEFNCIGSMLLAFGRDRHDRERAKQEVMNQVFRRASLKRDEINNIEKPIDWSLDVIIPFSAFFKHKEKINGKLACNIYKCGDLCKCPHYQSWQPIFIEKPDFHRPEYFTDLNIGDLDY